MPSQAVGPNPHLVVGPAPRKPRESLAAGPAGVAIGPARLATVHKDNMRTNTTNVFQTSSREKTLTSNLVIPGVNRPLRVAGSVGLLATPQLEVLSSNIAPDPNMTTSLNSVRMEILKGLRVNSQLKAITSRNTCKTNNAVLPNQPNKVDMTRTKDSAVVKSEPLAQPQPSSIQVTKPEEKTPQETIVKSTVTETADKEPSFLIAPLRTKIFTRSLSCFSMGKTPPMLKQDKVAAGEIIALETKNSTEDIAEMTKILTNISDSKDNSKESPVDDLSPNKCGGILRQIVEHGKGEYLPQYGDWVSIKLEGRILNDDNIFDARKAVFRLGFGEGINNNICEGIEQALRHFKQSETSLLTIQPQFAYKSKGNKKLKIPRNATLQYTVQLYQIEY